MELNAIHKNFVKTAKCVTRKIIKNLLYLFGIITLIAFLNAKWDIKLFHFKFK